MKPNVVNALSVDVEEYYHALIFQEATQGTASGHFASRIEDSVERVLALLADRDIRATFFVLGEVASAHPSMVRKIAQQGHEVACHGNRHEPIWRHTPHAFGDDIRRAKALLEDLTGQPVVGYRAPNFSIGQAQTWAYDILLHEGFLYDSSCYPILHDRYGDPRGHRFPYEIQRNGKGGLMEFPIGTTRLLGVNLPIGGGGYFRLLPLAMITWGIHRVNAYEKQPVMFYFHPWELDPGQPRPAVMPWYHRFRHYVGLTREEAKLSRLLRVVRFTTVRNILRIPQQDEGIVRQQEGARSLLGGVARE